MKSENQQFETGAVRGTDHTACYLHLIPPEALRAWGEACAVGSIKYGVDNYLKGIPTSNLLNHALHHILNAIEGDKSEDHLGHALWNIGAAIHFCKHRPDMVDHVRPYNVVPSQIEVKRPRISADAIREQVKAATAAKVSGWLGAGESHGGSC